MKHQLAAMLSATAVLGVTTAFGANPFSDVTPDSWAYQSVSQLGHFETSNIILAFESPIWIAINNARKCRATSDD